MIPDALTRKTETSDKANAVEKALRVLNQFTYHPYAYSARDLSDILGYSKPTVHRILNILEEERFIRRTENGEYTVGYKAYHVGMVYANQTDTITEIRKIVDNISRTLTEQVGYAVLEGSQIISLYESRLQYSRVTYVAGVIYPINSGCYGKTLMAFSHTEEELKRIVPTLKLEPVSTGAILSHKELLEEYLQIRRLGYAESSNEFLDGTIGIGVPTFRKNGTVHGCIAVGTMQSPQFEQKKPFVLRELQKGASLIGELL